jgi:hypothetical protein
MRFSQAHLIANFDAHYLDNNTLSRNELSTVQPGLRAHSRRRDLHDSAVNKPYRDPQKSTFRYMGFMQNFFLHQSFGQKSFNRDRCLSKTIYTETSVNGLEVTELFVLVSTYVRSESMRGYLE